MSQHVGIQEKKFDGQTYILDSWHWTYETALKRKNELRDRSYYVRVESDKPYGRVTIWKVYSRIGPDTS